MHSQCCSADTSEHDRCLFYLQAIPLATLQYDRGRLHYLLSDAFATSWLGYLGMPRAQRWVTKMQLDLPVSQRHRQDRMLAPISRNGFVR